MEPLHKNLTPALCMRVALFLPIDLMKTCITADHESNAKLTAEFHRRTRWMNIIERLIRFTAWDWGENLSITLAARKWELNDPVDADLYKLEVSRWKIEFKLDGPPKEFEDHITVKLLESHKDIIDFKRNGLNVLVTYDKILKLMKVNESVQKTVNRIYKDAGDHFDSYFQRYITDDNPSLVEEYSESANEGYTDLFKFFDDVSEIFLLMGYDKILQKLDEVSYVHLSWQRDLVSKCLL